MLKIRKEKTLAIIQDTKLNLDTGTIDYAVLSFVGFLGMGDKLCAILWSNIRVDQKNQCCVLNMSKKHLEKSPAFDKEHWPKSGDTDYLTKVYDYHKVRPFWSES
jgi:hypothetical protein